MGGSCQPRALRYDTGTARHADGFSD
jgi:Thioredoxin